MICRLVLICAAGASAAVLGAQTIAIDYPLEGSIFLPEITAPTFLWRDPSPTATPKAVSRILSWETLCSPRARPRRRWPSGAT